MPNNRPASPLRWLRRALLAAMLVVLGAVVGLFYLGRSTRPRGPAKAAAVSTEPALAREKGATEPSDRDTLVVTQGFEYEQQVEGKPVFRIRGDRMTTDRGGKVELEGVGLELYREGEPYTMRSQHAVYDRATGEAQLVGDVQLEGAEGWRLNSDRFDLVEGGKTVVSGQGRERVQFRRGDELEGTAGRLRFEIESERLELTDTVKAVGHAGDEARRMTIDARRMTWERSARTIESEGAVELTWAQSWLHADQLHTVLREDESGVESVVASGGVTGLFVPEKGSRVDLEGARCVTTFDVGADSPSLVELEGSAAAPAKLDWSSVDGKRRVVAPEVQVHFAGGNPSSASARGGVLLTESAADGTERRVKGKTLDAGFDADGSLSTAKLGGGVEIHDGEMVATGDDGDLSGGGERIVLNGKPARGKSPRGEIMAPRLLYERSAGRMSANGGVRARFEPESSPLPAGEPAKSGREPVQVEAKSGMFFEKSRGFVFEGNVQAIQGTSFLFADKLEADEASGTTTATGSVRTIWQDHPAPGQPAPEKGKGQKAPETVATAESLVYQRSEGVLRYAGDVDVRQAPRQIRASEIVVKLSDDHHAEKLHAKGAVVLTDSSTGQTVQGDEADYDFVGRSAEVTGALVAIKDKDGNVLRGKRARFDLVTGAARLVSEES